MSCVRFFVFCSGLLVSVVLLQHMEDREVGKDAHSYQRHRAQIFVNICMYDVCMMYVCMYARMYFYTCIFRLFWSEKDNALYFPECTFRTISG